MIFSNSSFCIGSNIIARKSINCMYVGRNFSLLGGATAGHCMLEEVQKRHNIGSYQVRCSQWWHRHGLGRIMFQLPLATETTLQELLLLPYSRRDKSYEYFSISRRGTTRGVASETHRSSRECWKNCFRKTQVQDGQDQGQSAKDTRTVLQRTADSQSR